MNIVRIDLSKEVLNQLTHSIEVISHYCHSRQSCDKCLIKSWCKEKRKKCPEEWIFTKNWRYGGMNICQEIDTQVVDQDKKN